MAISQEVMDQFRGKLNPGLNAPGAPSAVDSFARDVGAGLVPAGPPPPAGLAAPPGPLPPVTKAAKQSEDFYNVNMGQVRAQAQPGGIYAPGAPSAAAQALSQGQEAAPPGAAGAEGAGSGEPGIPQPRYVRSTWSPELMPYKEKELKTEQDLLSAQQSNIDRLAEAEKTKNLVQTVWMNQQAEESQRLIAEQQNKEVARQQYMAEQRTKAQQAVDDVTSARIDPQRLYGHADTATKLSIIVGGALGGFLAGRNGGRNQFMDSVTQAIDRDIDAQKEELASKKFAATGKMNMLGELRAQFGDERMAENVYRQSVLALQKQKLDAIMVHEQNPMIQARAEVAKTGIEAERLGLAKQYDAMTFVRGHMDGGSPAPNKDEAKLYIPRAGGNALTEDEAKEARKRGAAFAALKREVATIQQLRAEGAQNSAEGRMRIRTHTHNAIPAWMESKGLQRLSEVDEQLFHKSIGDTEAWLPFFGGQADAQLDEFGRSTGQQEEELYRSAAVGKAHEGYAVDPKTGRVVRANELTGADYTRGAGPQMPKPIGGR